MGEFQRVCKTSDVPEGEGRMFVVGETIVGVFRIEGQFYALDNQCPHQGASLAHGIIQGGEVSCRIHHWRFRIADGKYLDEDRPSCDARVFEVQVQADDVLVEI